MKPPIALTKSANSLKSRLIQIIKGDGNTTQDKKQPPLIAPTPKIIIGYVITTSSSDTIEVENKL